MQQTNDLIKYKLVQATTILQKNQYMKKINWKIIMVFKKRRRHHLILQDPDLSMLKVQIPKLHALVHFR